MKIGSFTSLSPTWRIFAEQIANNAIICHISTILWSISLISYQLRPNPRQNWSLCGLIASQPSSTWMLRNWRRSTRVRIPTTQKWERDKLGSGLPPEWLQLCPLTWSMVCFWTVLPRLPMTGSRCWQMCTTANTLRRLLQVKKTSWFESLSIIIN